MDAIQLRPLSLGELLDRTFSLYRNHFWLFVGIMAIPSAFSVPWTVMWYSLRGASIFAGRPAPGFAAGMAVLAIIFFTLFWAVYVMAIGAATYAVSDTYLGQQPTVRGSYGKVRQKFWSMMGILTGIWLRAVGLFIVVMMGVGVIVAISVGVMTVAARGEPRNVVGAIIGVVIVLAYLAGIGLWVLWSLRYAVSIQALLLEDVSAKAAIRRSVLLTKGRHWQLFIAIVLSGVIAYVGVIVFQGPFIAMIFFAARSGRLPDWLAFTSALAGALGGAITGPILMIVLVLCYYDTRVRKEAFDLQFMMSSLDGPAPAPGAVLPN